MNNKILKTILILILGVFSFILLNHHSTQPAQATSPCPSYMDPNSVECFDYLSDQLGNLVDEQGTLQDQLAQEEYEQLSLAQKIAYITTQVAETEKVILTLELKIATNDVQIKLLETDIQDAEDYVSLMKQEINQLESSVNQRITESYKYSFVGPMEIFLDNKGLGNILRKVKYLASTREQDKLSLEDFSKKILELELEEEKLETQQAELQLVRNAIEEEKTELFDEKQNLTAQRIEKNRLLAQSKAEAQALATQIADNAERQTALDAALIAYIEANGDQMRNYGNVSTGTWIGRVSGATHAHSTGPHLHFAITSGSTFLWANIPLLNGHYNLAGDSGYVASGGWHLPIIVAGTLRLPLNGELYLSQDYHQGYSLDMWRPGIAGDPVYAVMEGVLWKGFDGYSHYAIIKHPNGWRSIYLHLE